MVRPHFAYWLINEYLSGFHFSATMSSAVINICEWLFVWTLVFISLGYFPGVSNGITLHLVIWARYWLISSSQQLSEVNILLLSHLADGKTEEQGTGGGPMEFEPRGSGSSVPGFMAALCCPLAQTLSKSHEALGSFAFGWSLCLSSPPTSACGSEWSACQALSPEELCSCGYPVF